MMHRDEITESSRKVRKALRVAFPKAKISVRSRFDIEIEWDGSITDVDGMKTALLKSGVAQPGEAYWNGEVPLEVDSYRLHLWCFNRAERDAAQRGFEQRNQERQEQDKRERAGLEEARRAKVAARPPIPFEKLPPPDPVISETFEQLRQKAEAQVETHEGDRRPSWAPPLIFDNELTQTCRALGWLATDKKPIGRLWATFATPKRSGRYVREHISTVPLHGVTCRGFQLFAGDERGPTSEVLFEAQRREDGTWSFGPSYYPRDYTSPRARKWEHLIRERERISDWLQKRSDDRDKVRLATVISEIAAIDAEDASDAARYHDRHLLRQRAYRLAQARVLDFAGAPDAQMHAAGRLWGHCCRCGKALTDPLSVERGIGPDCYQKILLGIRELAADGRSINTIARLVGMSDEFVNTVLGELTRASERRSAPGGRSGALLENLDARHTACAASAGTDLVDSAPSCNSSGDGDVSLAR